MAKFQIRNKKRQKFPLEIVDGGKKKLTYLLSKGSVFSEEKTNQIKSLENKKLISVAKIVDEDEDG